jgi:hypothetical protein
MGNSFDSQPHMHKPAPVERARQELCLVQLSTEGINKNHPPIKVGGDAPTQPAPKSHEVNSRKQGTDINATNDQPYETGGIKLDPERMKKSATEPKHLEFPSCYPSPSINVQEIGSIHPRPNALPKPNQHTFMEVTPPHKR